MINDKIHYHYNMMTHKKKRRKGTKTINLKKKPKIDKKSPLQKQEGGIVSEGEKKIVPLPGFENQAKWIHLQETAHEKALQFIRDPDLDHFAQKYVMGSLSHNTLRAYASDVKIFSAWCELRHFKVLPATPNAVANFLAAQAKQIPSLKASTIERRAAAIRYVHKMADLDPLPTDAMIVRQTLEGIRREKLIAPHKKASATHDIAQLMADQADGSTLAGLRDRALLLLGFAGAFRRSELVAVRIEDLEFLEKGMRVFIRKSKTDQVGKGRVKPILRGGDHCPVTAVQNWLAASGITEGFIFRRMDCSDTLRPSHNDPAKPDLSSQTVALIVKKYVAKIDLNPDLFAGHSLRRGFITSGLRAGKRIEKLIAVTHQTPKTLFDYNEDINQFDDHAGEGLL